MSSERPLIGVIEDDPIMGESLNQCLELEGYQVVRWRTGREAVAGLEKQLPDLVICDIRLPDISGEDVFRKIAPPPLFCS
jgi:CheY-like chemotaxis protein